MRSVGGHAGFLPSTVLPRGSKYSNTMVSGPHDHCRYSMFGTQYADTCALGPSEIVRSQPDFKSSILPSLGPVRGWSKSNLKLLWALILITILEAPKGCFFAIPPNSAQLLRTLPTWRTNFWGILRFVLCFLSLLPQRSKYPK